MLDNAGNVVQLPAELGPIENLVKMPIDDEIAVIGNQRPCLCLRLSYYRLASESALDFELNAAKKKYKNLSLKF